VGTSIINLEMDFRLGGVFCFNLCHPRIKSSSLSRDREFGRVCCSVSSETRVSGEGEKAEIKPTCR